MDRRTTPATDRVGLAGSGIDRDVITAGTLMRVVVPLVDLLRAPDGTRDRQMNFGADFNVIEQRGDWAFGQAAADGYCGWVRFDALTDDRPAITHRVAAPATHVYPQADIKLGETCSLSLGARLSVVEITDRFARLADGGYVPVQHVSDGPAEDPVQVALGLLGTPYLWGGNSRAGIDCSGLVQAALLGCGIDCPGDSDLQQATFTAVDEIARGDLLFWPGHVALAMDAETMIHATGWKMAVVTEGIANSIARIDAAGEGPFLGARRPLAGSAAFP